MVVGILTDLGHVTPFVVESYRKCNAILVESNHDAEMLQNGKYPPRLKRRIAGKFGHLSNAQTAGFLEEVVHVGLTHVVIGHISEQNNANEPLQSTFREFEKRIPNFAYATQTRGIGWTQPTATV
jgi:phosphoribosyl 1,2-cyclic phosphodiesterase